MASVSHEYEMQSVVCFRFATTFYIVRQGQITLIVMSQLCEGQGSKGRRLADESHEQRAVAQRSDAIDDGGVHSGCSFDLWSSQGCTARSRCLGESAAQEGEQRNATYETKDAPKGVSHATIQP